MTETLKSWFATRFARLSTGVKMLFILSTFLLPLGLIAIWASIQSAQQKTQDRAEQTLSRLEVKAQRINATLARGIITIGTASGAIALAPQNAKICESTLQRLEHGPMPGRYALFADSIRPRCASPGFAPTARAGRFARRHSLAEITPDGEALQLYVFGDHGVLEGVAEYSRETLSKLTAIPGTPEAFDLTLAQQGGAGTMVLRDEYEQGPFVRTVSGSHPVADRQLRLDLSASAVPITILEALTILLPVLMWLGASVIGWFVVDRYLVRPLKRMQRLVSAYQPGDRDFGLPRIKSPAREIAELGLAFEGVAQTVARHEAELEAAVERQTRLVREVHHRVKNNLQVVASLLNIHSRGSANEAAAAAYASIQRRVDALAVVHRNHYAELEENRGVALKPLVSELAANLRATAPANAANMAIRLDLEPYYATQDVAVSVAFLVTEVVEFAMFHGAGAVQVSLTGEGATASTAQLILESDTLRGQVETDERVADRFERIVTGLSRQLRSNIDRNTDIGRYALAIAVVDKADRG
ncbi:sensor histidine kinase [Sphingosinicella sp. BN140058]|uniref:sensor histidine kinase n=1 Tax=Sphingosinicella sp. BN140058 TaxID=1892855 RepID=UPI00101230D6|nr:sensor histidine kinase [Sphingosinicella sp. BN140058]QAY77368.1 HAMP domain-containing protein [Sphingosinicella sp. BN140058]